MLTQDERRTIGFNGGLVVRFPEWILNSRSTLIRVVRLASIQVHPGNRRRAMKVNVARWRGVAAWMGLVCLGLLPASSLSAQEPKLRATLKGHTGAVVGLAFSPDSKTLASASYDGTLKLWDMNTGKERATLGEYMGCLGYVTFSPDGKTLASGAIGAPFGLPDLGDVKLWDVATGKVRTTLKENDDYVHSVAFSPDGKTLASVNGDVTLWDLADNHNRATITGHTKEEKETSEDVKPGMYVAFSPDGKTLASTSGDKTVRLWDLAANKERANLMGHTESVTSAAFSPDGKTLASASYDKTVKLWDVATGKERVTLKGTLAVNSVAFSPDGRMLAAACGSVVNAPGELKVWDIATGK